MVDTISIMLHGPCYLNISWKDFSNDSIDGIWYDIHEIDI